MYFDRQIKYLNYYEDGERIKTAGFVRAIVRDDLCMMQIKINGLPFDGTFDRKVVLKDDDRESTLLKIRIHEGTADTEEMAMDRRSMGEGAMPYEDIKEIWIPISDNKEIRCIWNMQKGEVKNSKDKDMVEKVTKEKSTNDKMPEESVKQKRTEESEENKSTENKSVKNKEAEITADEYRQNMHNITQISGEDKWSRLALLYKHGNICGKMSDCIVIRPEDFVILPDRYYGLANNSFLLHGYHNYGYMILARYASTQGGNNYKYYIGVPGNFYEKEVQVALMFGFESFEGVQDYVQPGDFGYYMTGVEL
jgi:hypothetical protein